VESFNTLHLRAGMNDPTNPFIKDEFVRELSLDTGLIACHGTFVYLFLNGVYRGLYNPCEHVSGDFLQAYRGGGSLWDVIGPGNAPLDGDITAWNQLRTAARKDLTVPANYLDVAGRMDLTNFIDYLLPLIWADDDDWPYNNTRAARERVPGAPFRFYPWDTEFSFSSHPVSNDTIATTLSSVNPPWGTSDYQAMFNSLKKSPEFKLLFTDRVHRAFFNGGPLTDDSIRARYNTVKGQAAPSIPGFSDIIGTWINKRRLYVTNSFQKAGFLASSNAPVASQWGGHVPSGYSLSLSNLTGAILYTTNGADPRVAFTGLSRPSALPYSGPISVKAPVQLKARSLDGTNWSALVDLRFDTTQGDNPIRITEIMYHPPGGEAYEYIELENTGSLPQDLSGCSFSGIQYRFPTPSPELAPGARIVLANSASPNDFRRRYPQVHVLGWFDGSLDNGGERITLVDAAGRTIVSLHYHDEMPWPKEADGGGSSLEIRDPRGDAEDPGNWQASAPGGSPGQPNAAPIPPRVRINELVAGSDRDWIELANSTDTAVDLAGWSLSNDADSRKYVLPTGTKIPGKGYLRIYCDPAANANSVAPFRLDRLGETVALSDAALNRVDVVRFGPGVDGHSIGWIDGRWALCLPTPNAVNQPAPLGSVSDVHINEFVAASDGSSDWIELHNTGQKPVALQGCAITTSNAFARIAPPLFVAPGGFVVLFADNAAGANHLRIKLPAAGGWIALLDPDGGELERVSYSTQLAGTSNGRLPDGTGPLQVLPFSATPGKSNFLAQAGTRLRFSEVMAHSSSGLDWVEIENVSPSAIALKDYWIGVEEPNQPQARFPLRTSTVIKPGQLQLAYFGGSSSTPGLPSNADVFPTPLRDEGAVLTLNDPLDQILDRIEYGLQIADRSIGRVGADWALLAAPSPGQPNGGKAALDAGRRLRVNEWLATAGGTNEFVEIYNPGTNPVDLAGWVLTDDPSISGSTNNRIGSLTFINAAGFVSFHADGNPKLGANHTSFQLDRLGETIRLLDASGAIIDNIDMSVQLVSVSEGRYPDGADEIVPFPGSASPGAPNWLTTHDADRDGMDDLWERAHGLNPASATDATEDPDGDGASNLQEFLAGTDPQDPASVFRLEVTRPNEAVLQLRFVAQPGQIYHVQVSDALPATDWKVLATFPADNHVREVTVSDPIPLADRTARFYRVLAE
jgi:hypothetical protein